MPLWPLVYALGSVSAGVGALVISLFGIGWLEVGRRLTREASDARAQDVSPQIPGRKQTW